MAAWAGNAAIAAPAPARRPKPGPAPKAKPTPGQRSPAARRPGLLAGVVWIVALAALLAGVVALNVAVLQLNQRLEGANERVAELKAANLALSGELSSAGSAPQVAAIAHNRLGLVPAAPDKTTYVDLGAAHRTR
ncbi:MAG: hypothetical protein ICV67_04505 [Thermoleophilia bacterium]|nr:hypothetical protein [Thermoleophilia bacterium]